MTKPKRGDTYCKSFSVVCSKLRNKMKKYSRGLIGCLDYGKDVRGDSDDLVTFLSILSEFSYCGAPGVSRYYKDWSSNPITLIALSDERDLLDKSIDYYFGSIVSLKTVDKHTLHTIALFLLHRLHEDLQCPIKAYNGYFQAHGHYTPGNYTAVAARINMLRNVRTGLVKVLKTVSLFASVNNTGRVSPFKGAKKGEINTSQNGAHPTPVTGPSSALGSATFGPPLRSPSMGGVGSSSNTTRRSRTLNGQAGKRFQSSFFSTASVCPNSVAQNNLIHETYDKIRRQARMTIKMTKFRETHSRNPTDEDMDELIRVVASTPGRLAVGNRMSFLVEEQEQEQDSPRARVPAAFSVPKPFQVPVPKAPTSVKPSQVVQPHRMSALLSVSEDSGSDSDIDAPILADFGEEADEVDEVALAVKRMVRFAGNDALTVNTSTVPSDLGSPIFPRHRTEQGQGNSRSSSISPRSENALSTFSMGVLVRRKGAKTSVEPSSPLVEQLVPSIKSQRSKKTEDFQSQLIDEHRISVSRHMIASWIAQVPWKVRTFRFNGFILYQDGDKPAVRQSTVMSPTRAHVARVGKL